MARNSYNNSNNAHKELLIHWLNDAYAMEQSLIPVMENHAKDAKDHPEMQRRIQEHAEETRRHAEMVKRCIERLGSSTSAAKTAVNKIMGQLQAISTGMSQDELVKNNIADIATEHFEAACYRSLIAAAEDIGDRETAQICEEILRDEEDMAHFLEQQLPRTTVEVLHEYAAAH